MFEIDGQAKILDMVVTTAGQFRTFNRVWFTRMHSSLYVQQRGNASCLIAWHKKRVLYSTKKCDYNERVGLEVKLIVQLSRTRQCCQPTIYVKFEWRKNDIISTLYTVWKFQHFSITHTLREINYGECKSSKIKKAICANWRGS